MQTHTDDKKITVEDYGRMLTGGWLALVSGGIGLAVLLTAGLVTQVVLPTGLAATVIGALITGTILLVGRLVLRKLDLVRVELDEHKADHHRSAVDLNDLVTIKKDIAAILAFIARYDLERKQGEELVQQIEAFMEWRAAAERRIALLEGDNVIDLQTVRDLNELSERRRDRDQ